MSEQEVEVTEIEDGGKPPAGPDPNEGIRALFTSALAQRESALMAEIREGIAELSKPVRTVVEKVEGQEKRTVDKGGERTIVSRHQPGDLLYERLHRREPYYKELRTPDLDHWNAHWIRAMVAKDRVGMQLAEDKLTAITGKRATTLEGAIDASDPTAILGGTGGHLLPQPLAGVVQIARDLVAVLPSLVQPFVMTSGTLRVPTSGAATAAMVAEGSVAAQGEPTFASDMLKAQKAQCFMKASVEMVADSAFNLISIYGTRAGAALGALEDVQIATSDGIAPNISEALSGGNVAEATTTVLIYEDLVTLYFALSKTYRTNAVWVGNDVTLTLLSTLMDGNDRPILSFPTQQPNVMSDAPGAVGSLFNKPVYEAPFADGTLVFGDLTGYGFGRRSGIAAAASEHADFGSDLIQFKFTERFDGRIIDAVAMKQMADLATVQ